MDVKITMPSPELIGHPQIETNYLVNCVRPKKKTSQVPQSLIWFFLVLQLCFGVDAGFAQMFQGRKKKIIKYISLIPALTITTSLIALLIIIWYREIWMWCTFLKYIIDYLNLKLINYKIYHFLQDIHELNENIPAIDRQIFGVVMLIYTLSLYISKAILITVRCAYGQSIYCSRVKVIVYAIISFSCLATETFSGVVIVIVFYVYAYAKHMKDCLNREFNLRNFESRYIAIARCCTKIKQMFNHIILVELFINTPRLMVTLWSMLVYIKENAAWYSYTSEWLIAFHLAIQMCIPAVVGEMVNCQIDSIKMMLNEERVKEKDRQKSDEITRILRYIKAQRLQTEIWRVIPVDLRLPLALLSLCTTYFIVILQFTHLYD